MRYLVIPLLLAMAACMPAGSVDMPLDGSLAASRATAPDFDEAVARVLPVASALCETHRPDARCDFEIVIDTRYKVTPNAYQTLDADRRPVLGVTEGLLAVVANTDELAFVLAHEAAHHIAGHDPEPVLRMVPGNGSAARHPTEARIAASRAMRRTELEADALGAEIAAFAGFNPLVGAQFFLRLPDPQSAPLSTHPGHAARWQNVTATVAALSAR